MLRRIVLENYMSHAHTVIEPAEGLTILVGPNNCGKSAVVSALQTLCSNLTGDYMVRHGQRDCRVTVETTDGHSITWQRKDSTVSYVVDGEEISRLRGGVPDRLHEVLRLPMVRSAEDDEDEFDIHFGTQKAPIFLINEPERRAAVFFAASSDAALLLQMQKRHAEKVKDRRRERDRLEKQSAGLDRELAALNPLGELSTRLQAAEQDHLTLSGLAEQLNRMGRELGAITRAEVDWSRRCAELAVLEPLRSTPTPADTKTLELLSGTIACHVERLALESGESQVLEQLREPPILSDALALSASYAAIAAEGETWRCAAALDSVLSPLQPLPDLHETAPLQRLVQELAQSQADCARLSAWNGVLRPLDSPPTVRDATPLEYLASELQRASELNELMDQSCRVLHNLRLPPTPVDPAGVAGTIGQLETAQVEIEQHAQLLRNLAQELAAVEQCIRQWARANPFCERCGAQVDPERLLAGAGHE